MNTAHQINLLLKRRLASVLPEEDIKDLAGELLLAGVERFSNAETTNQYRIYFIDRITEQKGSELVNAENDVIAWREFTKANPRRQIMGLVQVN